MDMTSGAELKKLREEAGLSKEWLAAYTGLSVRTVYNVEKGKTKDPSTLTLLKAALKDFEDLKQLISRCDDSGLGASKKILELIPCKGDSAAKALADDLEKNKIESRAVDLIYDLTQQAELPQLMCLQSLSVHLCSYLIRVPDDFNLSHGELLRIKSNFAWVLQIGLDKAGKKALRVEVFEDAEGFRDIVEPENAISLPIPISPNETDIPDQVQSYVQRLNQKFKYSAVRLPEKGDKNYQTQYQKLRSRFIATLHIRKRLPNLPLVYEAGENCARMAEAVHRELELITVNSASLPDAYSILALGVSEDEFHVFITTTLGEINRRRRQLESQYQKNSQPADSTPKCIT